ncbi:MAG: hypothetical protein ACR2OC_06005 [Solirubrobacterales bacterium]
MAALRTQIYLTAEQRKHPDERARREDRSLADLIREAVDAFLSEPEPDFDDVLDETFGACPDFEASSRDEWSEREKRLGV